MARADSRRRSGATPRNVNSAVATPAIRFAVAHQSSDATERFCSQDSRSRPPVVKAAAIDPVYFGVLFIMNNAIGLVTPPVGTVLNVVAGVGKMKMDAVTRGVIPFMLAEFAVMFLLVLFPSIVTGPARWLAN